MKYLLLTVGLFLGLKSQAQDLRAYQIYNQNSEPISFAQMAEELEDAEVILFGELHNNPICHWLQHELSMHLAEEEKLVLGAEFFETDNQLTLNQYLAGEIDAKALDTLARLWPNYKTDYAMLVDLAKEQDIPFIGTNIPRRYASMVYYHGFAALDTLSDSIKAWIAPLPISYNADLPGYKAMLEMMGGHGGETLPMAQAIKDATMAYFIHENLPRRGVFLHFNGDYHSKDFEGISWYLKRLDKRLKIKTISTQIQSSVSPLDSASAGHADYTLVIDEQVTTSY